MKAGRRCWTWVRTSAPTRCCWPAWVGAGRAACTRSNPLRTPRRTDAAPGAEPRRRPRRGASRKPSATPRVRARFRAIGMQGDNRLLPPGGLTGFAVATTSIDEFCAANALRRPSSSWMSRGGARRSQGRAAPRSRRRRSARAVRRDAPAAVVGVRVFARGPRSRARPPGAGAERLDGQPDPWSLAGVALRLRRCAS